MSTTLTVLDTTGIQGYVFGSNRLRENVGASELVEQATHVWPREIVRAMGSHNLLNGDDFDDARRMEAGGLDAEIVYAGGGNTVILFADEARARSFAGLYSRRLIAEAPGLEVVLAHQPVDLAVPGAVKEALQAALQALAQKKGTRPRSLPVLGLGVTAACQSTGLTASGYDPLDLHASPPRFRPVASEVLQKIEWSGHANARLGRLVGAIADCGLEVPLNFDDFGRARGEASYLAVVHADGNNMGQRFLAAADTTADNRAGLRALRSLSEGVNEAGQRALRRVTEQLIRAWDPKARSLAGEIAVSGFLPFRPLVFGGDDVTFVCDGRLGLTLAVAFLEEFERAGIACVPANAELGPVCACAGIAIIKTHYPFARAYALAEGLCRNAKQYVRRETTTPSGEKSFSALDWHFATGGLYGEIGTIRAREFTTPLDTATGSLAMRPLRLHDHGDAWRTWPRFQHVVSEFSSGSWKDKRNKVIGLREPLRQGPEAVSKYRTAYSLKQLPQLSDQLPSLQETGWYADTCGYFDAIEALDFCLPLAKEKL